MNVPNILSISRIFLLIPIIIFFENESYLLSIITFIIASVTDFLDGYIARKRNLVSKAAILIISREISISYLRLFIILNSKEIGDVAPDFFGKLKTAFQMIGLGLILITPITPYFFFNISLALILLSAFISWYSFFRYLKKWLV